MYIQNIEWNYIKSYSQLKPLERVNVCVWCVLKFIIAFNIYAWYQGLNCIYIKYMDVAGRSAHYSYRLIMFILYVFEQIPTIYNVAAYCGRIACIYEVRSLET